MKFDDESIYKELEAIDKDETVEVTSAEASFLEDVLHKRDRTKPLSHKQASWALDIIEKYER